METAVLSMRSGRVFEREVLGIDGDSYLVSAGIRPRRRSKNSSIRYIKLLNWKMYDNAVERGLPYCHNPEDPRMAQTRKIWLSVKKRLPRRVSGCRSGPLLFYISVGFNSLDFHHGVDFFFWWRGVYVSVDLTIDPYKDDDLIKADVLFRPEDLEPEALDLFGRRVADLLRFKSSMFGKKRRRVTRREKRKEAMKELAESLS